MTVGRSVNWSPGETPRAPFGFLRLRGTSARWPAVAVDPGVGPALPTRPRAAGVPGPARAGRAPPPARQRTLPPEEPPSTNLGQTGDNRRQPATTTDNPGKPARKRLSGTKVRPEPFRARPVRGRPAASPRAIVKRRFPRVR